MKIHILFLANLSAFAVGTCLGWTSPIAPKLKSDDTSDSPLDHKIDSTDDAWISSIVALGALVGEFLYFIFAFSIKLSSLKTYLNAKK